MLGTPAEFSASITLATLEQTKIKLTGNCLLFGALCYKPEGRGSDSR
jgi:hypothetical protein